MSKGGETMKIGEYFQQGDILIKRVSGLPKGEIIKAENVGYVLAEGQTGSEQWLLPSRRIFSNWTG